MSEVATVGWILLPTLFALFLYFATVLCVWPYARPHIPFFLLLLLVLFPPFFPGLLFYLVVLGCLFVPVTPVAPTVVIVERNPPRMSTRAPGNRV